MDITLYLKVNNTKLIKKVLIIIKILQYKSPRQLKQLLVTQSNPPHHVINFWKEEKFMNTKILRCRIFCLAIPMFIRFFVLTLETAWYYWWKFYILNFILIREHIHVISKYVREHNYVIISKWQHIVMW